MVRLLEQDRIRMSLLSMNPTGLTAAQPMLRAAVIPLTTAHRMRLSMRSMQADCDQELLLLLAVQAAVNVQNESYFEWRLPANFLVSRGRNLVLFFPA
jgi:hypothetical protein